MTTPTSPEQLQWMSRVLAGGVGSSVWPVSYRQAEVLAGQITEGSKR